VNHNHGLASAVRRFPSQHHAAESRWRNVLGLGRCFLIWRQFFSREFPEWGIPAGANGIDRNLLLLDHNSWSASDHVCQRGKTGRGWTRSTPMKCLLREQKRAPIFVKYDKNERESKVFFAARRLRDDHPATAKTAAEADLAPVDHIGHNQGAQPFIGSQLGDCGDQFSQGGSVAAARFRTVWFHGALH
jgi:hypothetical protein